MHKQKKGVRKAMPKSHKEAGNIEGDNVGEVASANAASDMSAQRGTKKGSSEAQNDVILTHSETIMQRKQMAIHCYLRACHMRLERELGLQML
jgi:hypothetical protein